jgi:protein-S-isoprenylcysteine O-methyltransferase Ste14
VVWAVVLLHRVGSPRPAGEQSSDYAWEHTGSLITTGIFRYIRHPMYASLLLLAWGAFLKSVSVTTSILVVVATLAVMATVRLEEVENLVRFGQAYRDYMERTRRFVPFLF